VLILINNIMETHYEKYKETIKKVARRNYRQRIVWLNKYLAEKFCEHCGESETVCLKFYPYNKQIRKLTKRKGMNEVSRKEPLDLIKKSTVVCSNCFIKLDNDLIEFIYNHI
jgi:hypothetical protein